MPRFVNLFSLSLVLLLGLTVLPVLSQQKAPAFPQLSQMSIMVEQQHG